ncbi:glycosyltransferase family 4 protein [Pseudozobellia thermophila]|uniref:Glycosyltransferase involved in cell wall bisynthesis n=1 Tax=Pseudozobellia thermophila TaxID=192903 RepID=A0A1M6KP52_9FLAO|nr:glycosyltransferase [Pseudozobellia thermophila]SHJ60696.1 Glycosyltransferase involved in cell wall bisynthesis [Pseudozobellia thermophila]
MRILWFSNTPSLAAKKVSKNTDGGSWIESLEKELASFPDIELGIAFKRQVSSLEEIRVEGSRTRYFMVPQYPIGKFKQWVDRFLIRPPSRKSLPHYLKVVEDFNPDLILFFGTEFDYPLIIPKLKVPSIIWFQGNLTVYNEMYENGIRIKDTFTSETIKRLLKCHTIYHEHKLFVRRVEREKEIFSIAENFIGRTDWDRRLVRVMAPKANYYHSEEALRESFWKYQWKLHEGREKFVVSTVIRGQLYKGLETVFKSAILLENLLPKRIEWNVIGIKDGVPYAKAAKKKAGYTKKNTSVKLLGPKFGDELVRQLIATDVYVHPSHIENSSNAIQEAMLLGMPVVATNTGGTQSIMDDNKEGLLVQSKDSYALAGAILELFESPSRAVELGKNARSVALKRNDNKKICKELIATFNEVIAQYGQ